MTRQSLCIGRLTQIFKQIELPQSTHSIKCYIVLCEVKIEIEISRKGDGLKSYCINVKETQIRNKVTFVFDSLTYVCVCLI